MLLLLGQPLTFDERIQLWLEGLERNQQVPHRVSRHPADMQREQECVQAQQLKQELLRQAQENELMGRLRQLQEQQQQLTSTATSSSSSKPSDMALVNVPVLTLTVAPPTTAACLAHSPQSVYATSMSASQVFFSEDAPEQQEQKTTCAHAPILHQESEPTLLIAASAPIPVPARVGSCSNAGFSDADCISVKSDIEAQAQQALRLHMGRSFATLKGSPPTGSRRPVGHISTRHPPPFM